MKKTYQIFTGDMFKFTDFINSLSNRGHKFSVSPWASSDGTERGFVVWYFK